MLGFPSDGVLDWIKARSSADAITDWSNLNPAFAPLTRLAPDIISVVDYSKGFGHSDTFKVAAQDTQPGVESRRENWLAHLFRSKKIVPRLWVGLI